LKSVLITGATGFVGRQCLPLLVRDGFDVHAISSGVHNIDIEGVTWRKADLLSKNSVEELLASVKAEYLLHLAWITTPGIYWNSPDNHEWTTASVDLFRRFIKHGGRRIVATGSCAEYDWRFGLCSEELTPLAPSTTYGKCKHELQTFLEELGHEKNISAAWARLFYLYGPFENKSRLIPSVIYSLLRGERARCTSGEQVRDYLYVYDAANALVSLLGSSVNGAINIGSGRAVEVRRIVELIAGKLGKMHLLGLGDLPCKDAEPYLIMADNSRLMTELNWREEYTLEQGLNETLSWWENRYNNGDE